MLILGNLCWVLAALIYAVPWQLTLNETGRGSHAGGALLWMSIILALPLGVLMTIALCVVAASGGMHWLPLAGAPLYGWIIVSSLALTVVIALSSGLRLETPGQRPWAIRRLVPAAAWVLPPVVIGHIALALNASAAPSFLLVGARALWMIAAVGSVLIGLGMLIELRQSIVRRRRARLEAMLTEQNQRDRSIAAEVAQMNCDDHFSQLLNFCNVYADEAIRQLALTRLAAHPDLCGGVQRELTEGRAYEAIIYLQAQTPAHPERLKDAVRVAIERIAEAAKISIAGTHTLHAGQCLSEVERILDVVEKFMPLGVDYRPALTKLRRALDDRRPNQVQLLARAELDRWLEAHH